jgi:multisubunit Na+/H+ antiporter MnhG subunit
MVDAIIALAKHNSMYTLKHTGTAGMVVNVVSLIVAFGIFAASPRGQWLRAWWAARASR